MRAKRFGKAGLAIVIATALLTFAVWPQPAHADWRSLSGGFLPAFSGSMNFQISPDSRTVAFIADKDADDVDELYAVPITGTTPIKLNPPLVAGGEVENFQFTPDGQFVIYRADQEVDQRIELYRVPVGGGMATKLNAALVAGGNVTSFKIAPDTGRIAYVADQETNEIFELWSISGTGGGLFKLSGAMVSGGDVGIFEIDPLSDRAVFSADREMDGKYELYSTPMLGGAPTKLNPPITLQGGGDAGLYSEWAINPVIPVVAFIARGPTTSGGKVYSNATAGGLLTEISFNLTPEQRVLGFRISPAGDRVVYNIGTRLGSTNAFKGNLYSSLIGGGGNANLTEIADPLFGVDSYGFRFTPDGSRVVYNFQKNAAAQPRFESSVTATGVRATLYAPGAADPQLSGFDFSPNGQWVMYQTSSGGPQSNIRTVPPTGGGATGHGSGVYRLITPDSGRIAYTRIVSDAIQTTDLFSAQIFGGDERNLSGMNGAGYVGETKVIKDGQWIVFVVQINSRYDLRVSDGNVAQPPPPPTYAVYLPITTK
jgi:Tol biopolymer transport system component